MIYINFSSVIDAKTTQNLMKVISDRVNAGDREICILFSSSGGQVNEGVALYNYLKSLPLKTSIYNVGIVDSIANVIFLGVKERYAVPNSSFLFHGIVHNFNQPVTLNEKQLKEVLLSIERSQLLISQIISQNTSITVEELKEMFLEKQRR